MPDKIKNAPALYLGLALYLNAWFELDLERDRTKLEPIKRSSCFEYAADFDLTEEQADDLWFYIQRMDRDFLAWYKTKLPKPPKTGKARRGGKP